MGNQVTFQDIFKKSFLDLATLSDLSVIGVFVSFGLTLVIALFIFQIYKATFRGVVYNHSFNTSLVLLALVTTMVIMTISSNIVLSLGMVGALSIVRFRAAIKDPRDIVFMFWSIASGIASGAGMHVLAIGGSLFIGIVLLIMSRSRHLIETYLLIIRHDKSSVPQVIAILSKLDHQLKSKVISADSIELTLELKNPGENTTFVDDLSAISGVSSAVLVKYNGEYAE